MLFMTVGDSKSAIDEQRELQKKKMRRRKRRWFYSLYKVEGVVEG
ncbi:hypothetical protein HanXRQr2_Chr16g0762831 [Helianthus annuus]|uniref:Uncharacterized protein n=1 Tax=Helianthus annuus TaxID=4232 RepID=A0A9K3GZV1_HELAN|nr:hypothetical protein HanXRQr2_Chr16g0762831 [Helianthus annuus]KAJ0822347.1 hypothetical protein HanPSC8_Chr16g0730941 [Helianthus annuus]